MKDQKSTSNIVFGGGWPKGKNTRMKTVYTSKGFDYYLRIEILILLISLVLGLLAFVEAKISEPSTLNLTLFLKIFLPISQPIMIFLLIKSYGKKSAKSKIEVIDIDGEEIKIDPQNLH